MTLHALSNIFFNVFCLKRKTAEKVLSVQQWRLFVQLWREGTVMASQAKDLCWVHAGESGKCNTPYDWHMQIIKLSHTKYERNKQLLYWYKTSTCSTHREPAVGMSPVVAVVFVGDHVAIDLDLDIVVILNHSSEKQNLRVSDSLRPTLHLGPACWYHLILMIRVKYQHKFTHFN